MRKLTESERSARALLIRAEDERTGCGILEAIRRVNARFSETVIPAGRPATETARPRRSEAEIKRIIEQRVAEAVASGKFPGARNPGQPTPAPRPAVAPLHELPAEVIDAVAMESVTARSPFWRPRGNPAAGRVDESAPATTPDKPLHEMTGDEFALYATAAFSAYGAASGFASPSWEA